MRLKTRMYIKLSVNQIEYINNEYKMARQIQIRRGTAEEHESFTGAIGEVTMDTTNNTLRVHDGETIGGTALARADFSNIENSLNLLIAALSKIQNTDCNKIGYIYSRTHTEDLYLPEGGTWLLLGALRLTSNYQLYYSGVVAPGSIVSGGQKVVSKDGLTYTHAVAIRIA